MMNSVEVEAAKCRKKFLASLATGQSRSEVKGVTETSVGVVHFLRIQSRLALNIVQDESCKIE
jgi:hypothetical protein